MTYGGLRNGALVAVLASMLVSLVSWMDIGHAVGDDLPQSAYAASYGVAGSRLATTLSLSLLGSTAGAWPGRARITRCCTRPLNSFSLPLHHSTLTRLVNWVTRSHTQYSPHPIHSPLYGWRFGAAVTR